MKRGDDNRPLTNPGETSPGKAQAGLREDAKLGGPNRTFTNASPKGEVRNSDFPIFFAKKSGFLSKSAKTHHCADWLNALLLSKSTENCSAGTKSLRCSVKKLSFLA